MQVFHSLNVSEKADVTGLVKVYPTTLTNCSDTASLIDVIEGSIPADEWSDGEKIVVDWAAEFRNQSGGSRTLLTRVYYGSSYVEMASTDSVGTGLTRAPYRVELWRFGSEIWVAGWEYAYGYAVNWHGGAINAISGSDQFGSGKRGGILTSQTFNSTKALKIAVQFSATGSGQYYTVKGAKICKI